MLRPHTMIQGNLDNNVGGLMGWGSVAGLHFNECSRFKSSCPYLLLLTGSAT